MEQIPPGGAAAGVHERQYNAPTADNVAVIYGTDALPWPCRGAWMRSCFVTRPPPLLDSAYSCAGSACGDGQGALLTRRLEPRHGHTSHRPRPDSLALSVQSAVLCEIAAPTRGAETLAGLTVCVGLCQVQLLGEQREMHPAAQT